MPACSPASSAAGAWAELVDGAAGLRGRTAPVELADRNLAQAVELFIEPRFRPARIPEGAMMLGADHQQRVSGRRVLDIAERPQRAGKAPRQALGIARLLVDHTLQTIAGKYRYRRLARLQAALDRQRLPARPLLVLGKAVGIFAGVAKGGAIDLLRPPLAFVADHELQRPADGTIGAVALAQRVALGVHPDPSADRTVDHEHRPDKHR